MRPALAKRAFMSKSKMLEERLRCGVVFRNVNPNSEQPELAKTQIQRSLRRRCAESAMSHILAPNQN